MIQFCTYTDTHISVLSLDFASSIHNKQPTGVSQGVVSFHSVDFGGRQSTGTL